MRLKIQSARPIGVGVLLLVLVLATQALAGQRVPGGHWMRYAKVEEAGFDESKLEAARQTWQGIPSSAFMVVADGAVVAAWGEHERRFMCHSVRKSFLSALYGIYWDQGKIELNKTLADLGIDDEPDPLLETEKQARILDLLKARSGVFHPAAYAGRTDSQQRGSQGPGRYFAYNNWDFNTLAAILEQETGDKVFEAFERYFAHPLGMEDWRLSDGYYHFERDKSKYPAYPFRLSARDAARFGLLFARDGVWGDQRILSQHWVRRSSALYSIDNAVMGYGFMWWVLRDPRLERYGMYTALGVGNQMIAVLPKIDLVIVNRANTYQGQSTPTQALLDLIHQVLEARMGPPAAAPGLEPLGVRADPRITHISADHLGEFVGEWSNPPSSLGLPSRGSLRVSVGEGHLVAYSPFSGTFRLYLQPNGSLLQEDTLDRLLPVRDHSGSFNGFADPPTVVRGAIRAEAQGRGDRVEQLFSLVKDEEGVEAAVGGLVVDFLHAKLSSQAAEESLHGLTGRMDPTAVERTVNLLGYEFLRLERGEQALKILELNTRVFPDAFNAWDSLGEAHMSQGNDADAIRSYQRSLELNPNNANAQAMIQRIGEKKR